MSHEKEIAYLRGLLSLERSENFFVREVTQKALKIIEAQQLEIEALKESHALDQQALKHYEKYIDEAEEENAQLKEELNETTKILKAVSEVKLDKDSPSKAVVDAIAHVVRSALEQLNKK